MNRLLIASLLGLAAAPAGAKTPGEAIAGVWSAPGAILTLGAQGGRLEQGCATGSFGPVRLAKGRFLATGGYQRFTGGPQPDEDQRAGIPAPSASAVYEGVVSGPLLRLTVRVAGQPARHLPLRRDAGAKIVRCY